MKTVVLIALVSPLASFMAVAQIPSSSVTAESSSQDAIISVRESGKSSDLGTKLESTVTSRLENLAFDPSSENVVDEKRGTAWNITENRLIEGRYERFLYESSGDQQKRETYFQSMSRLLDLLLPNNPYSRNASNVAPDIESHSKAYEMLGPISQKLPEYDQGICSVIRSQIGAAHQAIRTRDRLYGRADHLEKDVKQKEWNRDMEVKSMLRNTNLNVKDGPGSVAKALEHLPGLEAKNRRIALQEARVAANIAQAETKLILSKAEFQSLIVQLFMQRRFQHVLVACSFYQKIFEDGGVSIKVEGKAEELLSRTGGAPLTVTTLEAMATEAIHDTRRGVSAVDNMILADAISSAEKRMLETFAIGEHLPEVITVPEESRKKIRAFRQARKEITKAVEVKDFGKAEEKMALLNETASDFDTAPFKAAIEGARLQSNMHLQQAKDAAANDDKATMQQELKLAAEVWPQNPNLAKGLDKLSEEFDRQGQALKEFTTLLKRKDFRGIDAKKAEFLVAVANDEVRKEELKAALEAFMAIEEALRKAAEYTAHERSVEAWEVLNEAAGHYDDSVLTKALIQASNHASEYIALVTKAKSAEEKHRMVSALSYYLQATKEHPGAKNAPEKVKTLSELILSTHSQPDRQQAANLH